MDRKRIEWHFDFGLCAIKEGQLIPESDCEALLNTIVEWAERNGYGVGGGYREYTPDEKS